MDSVILSQSLLEGDAQTRDPFQKANNQYQARNDGSEVILSNSPIGGALNPESINQNQVADFKPMLQKLGISDQNLPMNEMGKFQLMSRLKQKFGNEFQSNEQAMAIMDAFGSQLKAQGGKAQASMNESLANAKRTLGALMGGSNV